MIKRIKFSTSALNIILMVILIPICTWLIIDKVKFVDLRLANLEIGQDAIHENTLTIAEELNRHNIIAQKLILDVNFRITRIEGIMDPDNPQKPLEPIYSGKDIHLKEIKKHLR